MPSAAAQQVTMRSHTYAAMILSRNELEHVTLRVAVTLGTIDSDRFAAVMDRLLLDMRQEQGTPSAAAG